MDIIERNAGVKLQQVVWMSFGSLSSEVKYVTLIILGQPITLVLFDIHLTSKL